MFKGFYNLTSGMLTQQRNLNVVANNMTNLSTTGYKTDRYTSSTFEEFMLTRVGNKYKDGAEDVGGASYIRATSEVYTDFSQGVLEPTGIPLDFAIEGDGFFAIQNENDGSISYTRAGSFSLDEEGYLRLPGEGYVLGGDGRRMLIGSDKIYSDEYGRIYMEDGEYFLGLLGVFSFPDNAQLERNERGMFEGAGAAVMGTPHVLSGYLERSNSEMIDLMTEMITVQRALQSAAQVSGMYDKLMSQATTELGRL